MTLELDVLTPDQVEEARTWRNQSLVSLRTPYALTPGMQALFYAQVIDNRQAPHRYWALMRVLNPQRGVRTFVGMAGLTDIQWENGLAEISLLTDPAKRGQGIGRAALDLVLDEAFGTLRLLTVWGEVYTCNRAAASFWTRVLEKYQAEMVVLPRRKFWRGALHGAIHFTITVDAWRDIERSADASDTDTAISTTP